MYIVKLGGHYISDINYCVINKDEIVIEGIFVTSDESNKYEFYDRRFANKVKKYCDGEMIKIYGNMLKLQK